MEAIEVSREDGKLRLERAPENTRVTPWALGGIDARLVLTDDHGASATCRVTGATESGDLLLERVSTTEPQPVAGNARSRHGESLSVGYRASHQARAKHQTTGGRA